jgi:CDP-diacylglycerol--glycerol-3-phosphate 3-phosphatidyltransferase
MFRIICSFLLLFIKPLSILFFIFYLAGGISDILDGYLARKMNANSQFGAILDSISDLIFIGILLIIVIPLFHYSNWMLFWIGGIGFVRIVSLFVGYAKYHTIALLHTYANKTTGFILFFFPLFYELLGLSLAICLVCIPASISAIEELVVNMLSKELNRDIKSIFTIKNNMNLLGKF